jgi:hypothetical protein
MTTGSNTLFVRSNELHDMLMSEKSEGCRFLLDNLQSFFSSVWYLNLLSNETSLF